MQRAWQISHCRCLIVHCKQQTMAEELKVRGRRLPATRWACKGAPGRQPASIRSHLPRQGCSSNAAAGKRPALGPAAAAVAAAACLPLLLPACRHQRWPLQPAPSQPTVIPPSRIRATPPSRRGGLRRRRSTSAPPSRWTRPTTCSSPTAPRPTPRSSGTTPPWQTPGRQWSSKATGPRWGAAGARGWRRRLSGMAVWHAAHAVPAAHGGALLVGAFGTIPVRQLQQRCLMGTLGRWQALRPCPAPPTHICRRATRGWEQRTLGCGSGARPRLPTPGVRAASLVSQSPDGGASCAQLRATAQHRGRLAALGDGAPQQLCCCPATCPPPQAWSSTLPTLS